MTTRWVFDEVAHITERNLQLIRQRFESMSENQLNWKPSPQVWSLSEIFAHLNEYARFYHEALLKRIENTRFREPKESFTSSPLGRSAWQSMKLGNARNVKRRFRSPKAYDPLITPSIVSGGDVQTLKQKQEEFLTILEKALAVNIRKVKVPISVSKLVRLRLGDALLFVAYHNERHFQQAINLIKQAGFPRK
jgi:hypothetical protein